MSLSSYVISKAQSHLLIQADPYLTGSFPHLVQLPKDLRVHIFPQQKDLLNITTFRELLTRKPKGKREFKKAKPVAKLNDSQQNLELPQWYPKDRQRGCSMSCQDFKISQKICLPPART